MQAQHGNRTPAPPSPPALPQESECPFFTHLLSQIPGAIVCCSLSHILNEAPTFSIWKNSDYLAHFVVEQE